jgi:hypothetical protein
MDLERVPSSSGLSVMPFSSYKSLSDTIREYQVYYREGNFVEEIAFSILDYFREDLRFILARGVVYNSEYAICENIIYPILKAVWKVYSDRFTLWSHQSLSCDPQLSGFPEYILARCSPLGKIIFDKPYLLFVEAKQDKFDEGWGQCLAEMIAAQRLHEKALTIHGIVSNGKSWEFGKLANNIFTKNTDEYLLKDLDRLFAVVNFMFQQCEIQLDSWVAA